MNKAYQARLAAPGGVAGFNPVQAFDARLTDPVKAQAEQAIATGITHGLAMLRHLVFDQVPHAKTTRKGLKKQQGVRYGITQENKSSWTTLKAGVKGFEKERESRQNLAADAAKEAGVAALYDYLGSRTLEPKVRRVLKWGVAQGILQDAQRQTITKLLYTKDVLPDQQDAMIHLRGGTQKFIHGINPLVNTPAMNNRLEAIRVALLQYFAQALTPGKEVAQAVQETVAKAEEVMRAGGADASPKDIAAARQALQALGVNVGRWGP